MRLSHPRRLPLALTLYKYCRSAHAESALELGQFRLGTLRDYASNPSNGEMVKDSLEGTLVLDAYFPFYEPSMASQYPGVQRYIPGLLEGFKSNCVFYQNTFRSPNYLIFSASTLYSKEAHEKWFKAEGYDSCYQIHSARLFIAAISQQLGSRFRFIGARRIVYADTLDARNPLSDRNPVFVKRQSKHAEEEEFRIAWRSIEPEDPEPIIQLVPEARKYLSMFATQGAA
jgi:hypothetical protein